MGSESSVYEGKTLDDAVKKGLEALGLSRAEAMITILEEGSGGFLGLGSRPYRVRIMPRPGGAFPEAGGRGEGRSQRRGEGRNGRRERGGRRDERRASGSGERGGRGEGRRGESRGTVAGEHGGRERGPDERRGERRGDRGERGRSRDGSRGREGGRSDEAREPARRHEEPMRADGARAEGPREAGRRDEAGAERSGRRDEGGAERGGRRDEGGAERGGRRRRRGGRGRDPEAAPFRGADAGASPDEPMERAPRPERAPMTEVVAEDAIAVPAPRVAVHDEPEPTGFRAEREPRRDREPRESRPPREHEGPALSPAELVAESTRITSEFLKAMGFEATVTATAEADRVEVSAAVAQDEDLLNGKKGEVRQALQHLLNRMLNRGEGSRYHLQLEINDFWKRREEELAALARELAEEALERNDEAVTEYLNAQERRIVHMTLREDTRVKTYALGSGLIKRVAVAPADFPEGPRSE
jgi:predicted RNA-binding protein Jag